MFDKDGGNITYQALQQKVRQNMCQIGRQLMTTISINQQDNIGFSKTLKSCSLGTRPGSGE